MQLSSSQICYLYVISQLDNPTVTNVAKYIGYSKPSVINAFNKLQDLGLIIYNKKHIELTKAGLMYATNYGARRKAMIIFLKDILKIDEKQAIIDADKIMQVISCKTTVALYDYLSKEFGKDVISMKDICLGDCHSNIKC